MALERLTFETFTALEASWRAQCQAFSEDFDDFASERLEHARKIVAEDPQDPRYGIYAVATGSDYEALVHVNCAALPGSTGKTLRLVWVQLSPRFDLDDSSAADVARISTEILMSAIEIAKEKFHAEHIKLHLGNFADRQYFSGVAAGLSATHLFLDCRLRGNWFHLSLKLGS